MIKRLQDRLETARNNENGFTLIELLIVIVVLGILAGIAVLGLGTFRADAAKSACNADVKQVQTAYDAFVARPSNTTGTAPTGIDEATHADTDYLVGSGLLKAAPKTTGITWNAAGVVSKTGGC